MDGSRTDRLRGTIYNGNFDQADFGTVTIAWDSSAGNSNRYVDWINFNSTRIYNGNDYSSTTSVTRSGSSTIYLNGFSYNYIYVDYAPDSRGIDGTFVMNVTLKYGTLTCPLVDTYTRTAPTPTNTRTATQTSPPTNTATITRTPTQTLTPTNTNTPTRTLTPSYDVHAFQYCHQNGHEDTNKYPAADEYAYLRQGRQQPPIRRQSHVHRPIHLYLRRHRQERLRQQRRRSVVEKGSIRISVQKTGLLSTLFFILL